MSRGRLERLGLSLGLGALLGLSPLSGAGLGPSLAIGAAGGAAAFALLPDLRHGGRRWIPPSAWLVLGLLALVFAPTLVWMVQHWRASVWVNNHGLFIPPLVVALGYLILSRDREGPDEASAWGFPFLAAGLGLLLADPGTDGMYLSALGLAVALPGVSLLLLGARRTRLLAMPLSLTWLALPIPRALSAHPALQQVTAVGTEWVLWALGIPVVRDEVVLRGAQHSWRIAEACNGFSTLHAAIAVALVLACFCRSHRRRALILAAAPLLALVANVGRAVALVLLTLVGGRGMLDTPLHGASGVAALCCALVGLFLLADRQGLRRSWR